MYWLFLFIVYLFYFFILGMLQLMYSEHYQNVTVVDNTQIDYEIQHTMVSRLTVTNVDLKSNRKAENTKKKS